MFCLPNLADAFCVVWCPRTKLCTLFFPLFFSRLYRKTHVKISKKTIFISPVRKFAWDQWKSLLWFIIFLYSFVDFFMEISWAFGRESILTSKSLGWNELIILDKRFAFWSLKEILSRFMKLFNGPLTIQQNNALFKLFFLFFEGNRPKVIDVFVARRSQFL